MSSQILRRWEAVIHAVQDVSGCLQGDNDRTIGDSVSHLQLRLPCDDDSCSLPVAALKKFLQKKVSVGNFSSREELQVTRLLAASVAL